MVNGIADLLRRIGLAKVPFQTAQPRDVVRVVEYVRDLPDIALIPRRDIIVRAAPLSVQEIPYPALARLIVCRAAGNRGRQLRHVDVDAHRLKCGGELVLRLRFLHVRRISLDKADRRKATRGQEVVDSVIKQVILL